MYFAALDVKPGTLLLGGHTSPIVLLQTVALMQLNMARLKTAPYFAEFEMARVRMDSRLPYRRPIPVVRTTLERCLTKSFGNPRKSAQPAVNRAPKMGKDPAKKIGDQVYFSGSDSMRPPSQKASTSTI